MLFVRSRLYANVSKKVANKFAAKLQRSGDWSEMAMIQKDQFSKIRWSTKIKPQVVPSY